MEPRFAEGGGIQDGIEKGTDWESGQTKTGTTAEENNTQASISSFAGGSLTVSPMVETQSTMVLRLDLVSTKTKMSSGKKTTHNNVMLGHENNDKSGPTL